MSVETILKIKENYKRIEKSIVEQLFLEFPDHHPTTGSYREDVWYSLFRQIVPYKFAIEKGVFIIDSDGKISKEVDLAIFDEQYTPYIFNYGNVRFIPIEAVAVVIQCKSNNIKNSNLKEWAESINILQTNTQSITRIFTGVVNGFLDIQNAKIENNQKVTQTATRPIRILCYLNNKKDSYTKPKKGLFDILICGNAKDKDNSSLEVKFDQDKNLGEWYTSLNHNNPNLHHYKREYQGIDKLDDNYKVEDNSILSLIFQLNQILMLINNPMLFPHQAYSKMFNNDLKS